MSDWKWLEKYRIHESAEVKSRNLATRSQVVRAVIVQQIIQAMLGWFWMSEEPHATASSRKAEIESVGRWVSRAVLSVLGKEVGNKLLQEKGSDMVYTVYWWGIPIAQFYFAM